MITRVFIQIIHTHTTLLYHMCVSWNRIIVTKVQVQYNTVGKLTIDLLKTIGDMLSLQLPKFALPQLAKSV